MKYDIISNNQKIHTVPDVDVYPHMFSFDSFGSRCVNMTHVKEVKQTNDISSREFNLDGVVSSILTWNNIDYKAIVGNSTDIAFLGSSHCRQHADILKNISFEHNVGLGFLCKLDDNSFKTPFNEYDFDRIETITKWGPHTIVWMDMWGRYYDESYDFDSIFKHLLSIKTVKRLIIFGDEPLIEDVPKDTGILPTVVRYGRNDIECKLYNNLIEGVDTGPVRRKHERTFEQLSKRHPSVEFYEISSYFMNENGYVQLFEPSTSHITYCDEHHLSYHGRKRLEPLFRTTIFNEIECV